MPFRATTEFAWINDNETGIETGSFGPGEVPAKHYWGARRNAPSCISRSARRSCRWRSQDHFEINVYRPVIASAFLESLVLLADAVDSFRRQCDLNGTSLREEALASGLVSAGEFDALVRPEAMLAPDD
jgi:fumarate hydratase class II